MAMEQGRVTEFEGKSLDQIQIEPEGRAVEILSQTDGLKETSSGEPSTIHPDAPHGSGSAPSERREAIWGRHTPAPTRFCAVMEAEKKKIQGLRSQQQASAQRDEGSTGRD
uniref:Uncharacterized protein n=1 Tax=Knipowitschia caucasica TaxID=637954 RepID=A0AAV2J1M5_KNICA